MLFSNVPAVSVKILCAGLVCLVLVMMLLVVCNNAACFIIDNVMSFYLWLYVISGNMSFYSYQKDIEDIQKTSKHETIATV